MQLSVFVCLVLIGLLLAEGTSSGNCGYVSQPRDKPREIRGFQPEYVSTAIGFGKREAAGKQDQRQRIVRVLQEYPQ
ncbi:allatotropin-like, partial [Copidosoma floridanum]|uniref:allatotropin-like n=1 Tax=Copidosoma floridanum TaxID=29053 RepID=UPI000C6F5D1E